MELTVDLENGTVVLAHPGELQRFAVAVEGAAGTVAEAPGSSDAALRRLGEVLVSTGVGRLGGSGDAFIGPDAVRALAAGQVEEGWEEGFAGMCAYAATKGWIDESDGSIQAHVEWPT